MVRRRGSPRICAARRAPPATRWRPGPMRRAAGLIALAALLAGPAGAAANDPRNPTCPANPNWAATGPMKFTPLDNHGTPVLLAEGQIDADVVARLQTALQQNKSIQEIWLRSPGGDARAGTEAGKLIRQTMIPTRIPEGWACFSACNFMFMGGVVRYVDAGGL